MNCIVNIMKDDSPWHKHKKHEIVVCTKGEGTLEFDEEIIEMHPGKIVIVPPVVMHCGKKISDDYERI